MTSSAVVGSSQRISFGSIESAIAIITRCRIPPGELVSVGVVALRRVGDADQPHQLERALARAASAVVEPNERALGDLVARRA